jgi:glycosyltransferase involved in cell wall biosynthesis
MEHDGKVTSGIQKGKSLMNKKCLIIPTFNEEENIVSVVDGVKKNSDADIIVIDDGSVDLTAERAAEAGALVVRHPFNMGYGTALQTGYKYAVKKNYDLLVQRHSYAPTRYEIFY